jgi:LacI family transcriptional regulator
VPVESFTFRPMAFPPGSRNGATLRPAEAPVRPPDEPAARVDRVPDRGASLADVARVAHVSLATASRALSGRGAVAPYTRERVRAVAARLDFQPSAQGRALRTRTSGIIGFVVPDIASLFYANALKGAQHRLQAAGYHVALLDTDERPDREIGSLRALVAQQVDGIILCTSGEGDPAVRALIERIRVPIVFFDNAMPGVGQGSVSLANEDGMRLLVDHLVTAHGRRRLAYVGGLLRESSGAERLAGYRRALVENGLQVDESLIRHGDWTSASGSRGTTSLLALDRRPDAILYADALMALGGLAVLREHGLRVPDDVAIASFDDTDAGALLDPPLTTLMRRDRDIGDLAASLLLRILERDEAASGSIRIPMELLPRRSCGCRGDDEVAR